MSAAIGGNTYAILKMPLKERVDHSHVTDGTET
jgi:hypothetical protein